MVSNPNSNRKSDIAYALHPYTNLAAHEEQGPLVITCLLYTSDAADEL